MLARLNELDGVDRAEVDRAGELLRLTVEPGVLATAITTLGELGYEADVTPDGVAITKLWYDASSVGDLSFAEAGTIAARIVPPFAREQHLSAERTAALHDAVVAALHRSFAEHAVGAGATTGAFRQEAVRAAAVAASRIVGIEPAEALAALLELDLSQDHRR